MKKATISPKARADLKVISRYRDENGDENNASIISNNLKIDSPIL